MTEKYGVGNTTLTDALDGIMKDMDTKTAAAQAQYINNLKGIQDLTTTNLDNFAKLQTLNKNAANETSGGLLANNGAALQNTSLKTLTDLVNSGKLPPDQAMNLKSTMLTGIQETLGKL